MYTKFVFTWGLGKLHKPNKTLDITVPAGPVNLSTVMHLFQTICIIPLSSTKSKRTNFTEYLTIDMRAQAQRFYVYLNTNLIKGLANTLSAAVTSWHQASWNISVQRRVKHIHLLLHFPRMVRDRHYFRQTVITFKSQSEGSSFWGNKTILSNLLADSTHLLKTNRNKNIGWSRSTESLSTPHLHIKTCKLASLSLMPQSFGCQKG